MTESPNIVSERRLGIFTISGTSIWKEPEVVIGILSGCLIVRAEHTYASDQVNYTAFHKDFAKLEQGEAERPYVITCTRKEDGTTTYGFEPALPLPDQIKPWRITRER